MDATAAWISNCINWEKTDPLILRCEMNTHKHCLCIIERVRRSFQMASTDHHFSRQKANWCLLTHPNTHSLILRDTSPAGRNEDAAILNHTILPKLDISQRWQSGRGLYTWVNTTMERHRQGETMCTVGLLRRKQECWGNWNWQWHQQRNRV